ncbi:MAG TPA: hypothetical protein P5114_09515, partial [Hyphomicrobiaceae bacterium]|nr:hypothetical protein [Hyphomicrobiaceae bacterium]
MQLHRPTRLRSTRTRKPDEECGGGDDHDPEKNRRVRHRPHPLSWRKADDKAQAAPSAERANQSIFRRSGHRFVEENATKQEARALIRFYRIEKRSRVLDLTFDSRVQVVKRQLL